MWDLFCKWTQLPHPHPGPWWACLWPKAHFVIVLCIHPKSCTERQDADLKRTEICVIWGAVSGKASDAASTFENPPLT